MHFKLIVAFVEDEKTDEIIDAARKAGATGATVINNARGEGLNQSKTFFGLNLQIQRDMVLLLVEEHLSREVLETIEEKFVADKRGEGGIAFQIDVEDAVGVAHQVEVLTHKIEDKL